MQNALNVTMPNNNKKWLCFHLWSLPQKRSTPYTVSGLTILACSLLSSATD